MLYISPILGTFLCCVMLYLLVFFLFLNAFKTLCLIYVPALRIYYSLVVLSKFYALQYVLLVLISLDYITTFSCFVSYS